MCAKVYLEKARQICDDLHFLSQGTSPRIRPTWGARGVLCRRNNMKCSLGTRNGNIHRWLGTSLVCMMAWGFGLA